MRLMLLIFFYMSSMYNLTETSIEKSALICRITVHQCSIAPLIASTYQAVAVCLTLTLALRVGFWRLLVRVPPDCSYSFESSPN